MEDITEKKEGRVKKVKSVDDQRKGLKEVLPEGESGLPIVTIQAGEVSTSIEIPFKPLMDVLKKVGVNNRTVVEVLGVKIGIDVI